jgi:putative heme-binding domain-containing protein
LLKKLASESTNPLGRMHALWALQGFDALAKEEVLPRLKDNSPGVREHAIRLCETLLAKKALENDAAVSALAPLTSDPDPRVLLQLAFTLGELKNPQIGSIDGGIVSDELSDAVSALVHQHVEDPLIMAAVLSDAKLREQPYRLYGPLTFRRPAGEGPTAGLQAEAAKMIGAHNDTHEVKAVIDSIAGAKNKAPLVKALASGLKRAGANLEKADTDKKLAQVFAGAATALRESSTTPAAKLDAIALLEAAPQAQTTAALTPCLDKSQPEQVQVAAIEALARSSDKQVTQSLIEQWGQYTPKAREAALSALTARPERITALLTAMERTDAAAMKPADLTASQVQAILKVEDKAIAVLAQKILASVIPPSRESVIAKFQPALTTKGDVTKGQLVYMQRCFACHRAAGQGLEVGPDLITVKTKGRDALLTAILDPHKEVAPQFIAYAVNTKDGQTLSGIITQDDAASMTIKMMGGAQLNIPRSNIKGSQSSSQSLMPEGLETGMTTQEMADLLDFIEGLK